MAGFSEARETTLGAAIDWRQSEGKGRGVFARRLIRKDEVIECAAIVPVAAENIPEDGPPDGYVLDWDPDTPGAEHALVMGYIMLYNHGETPNVRLENDYEDQTVTVFALRDIAAGEELTWDYNCELWFDPA